MDNHQVELASSLHNEGYVHYSKDLSKIVEETNKILTEPSKIKEYPEFNYDIIPNAIYSTLNI